jgi:hypothetical protein
MASRPNDEMLLLAVAERDMGAFRTLYERHAGWLAVRLARRCNDRDLNLATKPSPFSWKLRVAACVRCRRRMRS